MLPTKGQTFYLLFSIYSLSTLGFRVRQTWTWFKTLSSSATHQLIFMSWSCAFSAVSGTALLKISHIFNHSSNDEHLDVTVKAPWGRDHACLITMTALMTVWCLKINSWGPRVLTPSVSTVSPGVSSHHPLGRQTGQQTMVTAHDTSHSLWPIGQRCCLSTWGGGVTVLDFGPRSDVDDPVLLGTSALASEEKLLR